MSENAYAIKKASFNLTLDDLQKARTDPNLRLTQTPFVNDGQNKVFLGRAAPWKGKKGAAFEDDAPDGVVRGLAKAISISKACEGVTGTVSVGGRKLPKKAVCQMQQGSSKKFQMYSS
jgi:hypothetical protein